MVGGGRLVALVFFLLVLCHATTRKIRVVERALSYSVVGVVVFQKFYKHSSFF